MTSRKIYAIMFKNNETPYARSYIKYGTPFCFPKGCDNVKKRITYRVKNEMVEKVYVYIPLRYIIALALNVLAILLTIGVVVLLVYFSRVFYLMCLVIQAACVIRIIASDDNPDYKVPWLLFVLVLPIVGFMLYFMFYSRKLRRRYVRRLKTIKESVYKKDDSALFEKLRSENIQAYSQAKMLTDISEAHLFTDTKQTYFPSGEELFASLLADLEHAKHFIFMEYFIIEHGVLWDNILDVLKRKISQGVDVKLVYDDLGCMTTLPGNYFKTLRKMGIDCAVFSFLRGNADSEVNNRSHRKITVIDGVIGYTGGANLADEYINKRSRFGHWKDSGIRLEGDAVKELTRLFLIDFGINSKKMPEIRSELFPRGKSVDSGYIIPFGDGPMPLYRRRVGKSVIQNMLNSAVSHVYMTTPYLIIDNDLCMSIENAALRGVDVRIIVPGIPDKKLVYNMTKSYYNRLMEAGVKIYEYTPGFIHAKNYVADGKYAMTGTINLDYRSLVHHFENAVWMYGCDAVADIEADILKTFEESRQVTPDMLKTSLIRRFTRSVVRIFSPLL